MAPGGKYCSHCKKNNHNTAECFKLKNQQGGKGGNQQGGKGGNQQGGKGGNQHGGKGGNQQGGKGGNQGGKGGNQGGTQGGNQGNRGNTQNEKKDINDNNNKSKHCMVCGLIGHETRSCNTKELDEDERCTCLSQFHRKNQCPWNGDQLKRKTAQDADTGKICQWCKTKGDGRHTFDDCKEPTKFIANLTENINRAYDDIRWCWHCTSDAHFTRACDGTQARLNRNKWQTKIGDIVQEWKHRDTSNLGGIYRDRDLDISMSDSRAATSPPDPVEYRWCIFCQDFGHKATDCESDRDEFDQRCPAQFKNSTDVIKPAFKPAGFSAASTVPFGGSNLTTTCATRGCEKKLTFSSIAGGFGSTVICPRCATVNRHPSERKNSQVQLIESIFSGLQGMYGDGGLAPNRFKRKRKSQLYEATPDQFKRPSVKLSKKLALDGTWPERQPRYTDMSDQGKKPRFASNIYNEPGNYQSYFPAIKFKIRDEWVQTARDDSLLINKAGRLGLVLQCRRCDAEARVKDAEGDFVMCGNDVMCTVGCGTGEALWVDERGRPAQTGRCRCLPILGQVSEPRWNSPVVWGR
ncbi:hypothetical protein BDV95DRAFT_43945 [Massariosphaeria phaeospora]|uniref:Uncharacterized protein n=1 Tax=Massariosphaeria phaeospora TaxID=100035 RepID=A0A7C8MKK8_9PLEO|nr:hypothetical protein BDV95DRAFT_43945 [Massariosphaeria phaeospora]